MSDFYNTFFPLLKLIVKILILLPVVFLMIGVKSNSTLFRKIAFKLFVIGIIFALILTVMHYSK